MNGLIQQLNDDLGSTVGNARRSLVQVHNGGHGSGAGTIWHPDGLIITCAHVVPGGPVRVTLPDGTTLAARVLGRDTASDVAALVVDANGLPTIGPGESRRLRPGQWVLALGHPWGVAGAVAGGVVIGAGADLPEMPRSGREWIAVSLPLRPGHSGGPLVDVTGRLVGINTMMAGPEVGMAVPVHVVKAFLRQELGSPQKAA